MRLVHWVSKCGGIFFFCRLNDKQWTQTLWATALCISSGRNPPPPFHKSTEHKLSNQARQGWKHDERIFLLRAAWPYSVLSVHLKLKLSALELVQFFCFSSLQAQCSDEGLSVTSTRQRACQIHMAQFSNHSKGHQSNPRQWVQWEKPRQTPATIISERPQVTS